MSTQTKIIAGVFAGIILLGAGYLLFFNNNDLGSALTDSGAPASAAEVQFLNLSSQISPISFDTSIFSDPRFTPLVDIHTAILPEPTGRTDPFGAINGVSTTGDSASAAP